MSNYFQVLKRIEQDRAARPTVVTAGSVAAEPAPPARHHDADEPPQRPLRALSSTPPPPVPSTPMEPPPPVEPLHPSSPLMVRAPQPEPAPPAPELRPQAESAREPERAPRRKRRRHASATPPEAVRRHEPATETTPAARRPDAVPAPEPVTRDERPSHAPPRQPAVRPHRTAGTLRPEAQRGIATLFDNIRALATGRATRTLVFAGAAPSDSTHAITDGLARHAARHAMQVLVAQLTHTADGPMLVPLVPTDGAADTLAVDLDATATQGDLNAWIDRIAGASDLVLVEAPPLAESIDAALLACACDGLVIVADTEVTPRAALQVAAERAQIAGCRTLGVVMTGTKERLPSWMRRILGADDHRGGAA